MLWISKPPGPLHHMVEHMVLVHFMLTGFLRPPHPPRTSKTPDQTKHNQIVITCHVINRTTHVQITLSLWLVPFQRCLNNPMIWPPYSFQDQRKRIAAASIRACCEAFGTLGLLSTHLWNACSACDAEDRNLSSSLKIVGFSAHN